MSKKNDDAQTLRSTSCDLQVLLQRMDDPALYALVGDDKKERGDLGAELARVLADKTDDIMKGDMRSMMLMLNAQAFTLNKMFNHMAGYNPDILSAHKHYFELALKAQNQCRRTLATMAEIAQSVVINQHSNDVEETTPQPIREIKKNKA